MNQQDFLRDCMSGFGIVPHDEFKKAYCLRCLNQECTWSVGATTSFVHRVANWKNELFEKIDRADDNDPRYEELRNKRFLPIVPRVGNVNTEPSFISPNMPSDTIPAPANFVEEAHETESNPQDLFELVPSDSEPTVTENKIPEAPESAMPDLKDLRFEDETAPDMSMPDLENPPVQITQQSEEDIDIGYGMTQNTNFQQGVMLDGSEAEKEKQVIPAGGTVILDDE